MNSNIIDNQVYLLVGFNEKDPQGVVVGVFADDTKAYQVAEDEVERGRLNILYYDFYGVEQVSFFSEQLSAHL